MSDGLSDGEGMGVGMALGMAIGIGSGVAMDNIAVGVALGVAIGVGMGAPFSNDETGDGGSKDEHPMSIGESVRRLVVPNHPETGARIRPAEMGRRGLFCVQAVSERPGP